MERYNFLDLLKTFIENSFYNLILSVKEMLIFKKNLLWWKIRLFYLFSYLISSPYRTTSHKSYSNEDFIYGETPILTAQSILNDAKANENDVLFDLGCGTGKMVIGAFLCKNMRGIGIDIIPEYIEQCQKLKKFIGSNKIQFINGDFTEADLSEGTLFYIAGTTFNNQLITKIKTKLEEVKHDFKIISLSQKIDSKNFRILKKGIYDFSWGKTTVYIQEKKG